MKVYYQIKNERNEIFRALFSIITMTSTARSQKRGKKQAKLAALFFSGF